MGNPTEISEIKSKVRGIVNDVVSSNTGTEIIFADEESLMDRGVLDSMSVLGLISSLENKFGIIVHPLEFSIENFDSVNNISDFLFNKINNHESE